MNSKIIILIVGLALISAFAWTSLKPNADTKGTLVGYHKLPSYTKTFYSSYTSSSSSSSGYSSSRSYSGGSYSYGK